MDANVPSKLIDVVDGLHTSIDDNARSIAARHGERLNCRKGCHGCCVDGLTVFEVEAAAIVRKHQVLLTEGAPHPEGACAFLDAEGGCRIYEERPYVCRTQGLPLRWIDDEQRELRDICELNVAGEPIEQLPQQACWPIGPVEARLVTLQAHVPGRAGKRVSLRGLFARR